MSKLLNLLVMTLVLSAPFAHAAETSSEDDKGKPIRLRPVNKCEHELDATKFRVIMSGSESKAEVTEMNQALHDLLGDGGLFERLGIDRPYQTIRFLPGGDLNIIGGLNNIPVAHWRDGAQVAQAQRRPGLLYELVIPGKTEHHSFYRADNTFPEQMSILFHALAGHVHVAMNSRFKHDLDADPVNESYALSAYMDTVRKQHDADEVSRWYQYLLSLDYAQDLIHGTYQTPAMLKMQSPTKDPKTGKTVYGFQPTPNILQAFVANLPSDMPDWKKEMARRFERLRRYIPGAVKTKILHEGYSTLMQELLPKHTPYASFGFAVKYCCLLAGVASPSIQNPYWIGTEAWRNIYNKFLIRPAIAALPTMEAKDRAFIQYARTEIIGKMNDADLLRFGLDADWVAKNNFALIRAYKDTEYNPWDQKLTPPDPRDPNRNWPYSILTRDPKKVIDALVAQLTGKIQYQLPYVELLSMNDDGSGQVALEVSDQVGRNVALDRSSIVETLYVMAQINERPVSLESTFEIKSKRTRNPWDSDEDDDGGMFGSSPGFPYTDYFTRFQPVKVEKVRMKVVVNPKGEVKAYRVSRSGSTKPDSLPYAREFRNREKHAPTYIADEGIAWELTQLIDKFIVDLDIERFVDSELLKGKNVMRSLDAAVDAAVEGSSNSLSMSVPTSSGALVEYMNFLGRRIAASLKYAIHGKGKLIRTATGVKIAPLPQIPYFRFDSESMQAAEKEANPMPLPNVTMTDHLRSYAYRNIFRPGDLTDIQPVPGNEGDVHWGPKPKKGKGKGDPGDEDSDDGDEPGGQDASDDGGEVMFENVSMEDYASALTDEDITLPNLRPKSGPTQTKSDELRGHRRQRTGHAVKREILKNAYKRGMPTQEELDRDGEEEEDYDYIKKGLARLKPERDWVVKDVSPIPNPDINALVVFEMDMSGSMESFKKTVKKILYDLRALLSTKKYKNVKFKFVVFNAEATVFDNAEDFFRFQPNGGTVYHRGWDKAVEIFKDFPEAQWDRYVITSGDMYEDFSSEEERAFTAMKEQSQYVATIAVNDSPGRQASSLEGYLERMAQEDDFVGFVKVAPQSSYTPLIFRPLFKNDK